MDHSGTVTLPVQDVVFSCRLSVTDLGCVGDGGGVLVYITVLSDLVESITDVLLLLLLHFLECLLRFVSDEVSVLSLSVM